MTKDNIRQTQQDFARAAERACQAGFQWLELHFAHGFLAQSFLSSQSNTRSDEYGGSLEGRARFLLETVAEVRKFWPDNFPLTVRLGVVEFDDCPEHSFSESLKVIGWLKDAGVDFVDVGLSLATPGENIPWAANFMIPWAARVRREKNILSGQAG
jgi:2,4-dienoyl-CoA reductase-like NADH-dependent reductase (Old Yellow Enzyme family)